MPNAIENKYSPIIAIKVATIICSFMRLFTLKNIIVNTSIITTKADSCALLVMLAKYKLSKNKPVAKKKYNPPKLNIVAFIGDFVANTLML